MAGKSAPGFFDTYQDLGGGGSFLKSEDKTFLIQNGIPFQIVKVIHDPENEYGPRFICHCLVPDPDTGEDEERKLGMPIGSGVTTRDDMLRKMKEYLDDGGDPVAVKLEKPGKAILLVAA